VRKGILERAACPIKKQYKGVWGRARWENQCPVGRDKKNAKKIVHSGWAEELSLLCEKESVVKEGTRAEGTHDSDKTAVDRASTRTSKEKRRIPKRISIPRQGECQEAAEKKN